MRMQGFLYVVCKHISDSIWLAPANRISNFPILYSITAMERDGVNFYSRNKNDFILAGSSRKYFLCYEQVFLYKIHSLSS